MIPLPSAVISHMMDDDISPAPMAFLLCQWEGRSTERGQLHVFSRFSYCPSTPEAFEAASRRCSQKCQGHHSVIWWDGDGSHVIGSDPAPPPRAAELAKLYPRTGSRPKTWPAPRALNLPLVPTPPRRVRRPVRDPWQRQSAPAPAPAPRRAAPQCTRPGRKGIAQPRRHQAAAKRRPTWRLDGNTAACKALGRPDLRHPPGVSSVPPELFGRNRQSTSE